MLSRELGSAGHYPAIDVLHSVSRLESRIATAEQRAAARKIREALATHRRSEDLINLGAYVEGSNPQLDAAMRAWPELVSFLQQAASEQSPIEQTMSRLQEVAGML